jgi:anti-sigma regulatory factor (Ser/Thr protein kinase)
MSDAAVIHGRAKTQSHEALFYRDRDEFVAGVAGFVEPGLSAGEAVAIAVPPPNAALLREELPRGAQEVEFLNMYELGRNPARIIPAVQAMIDRTGGRLHYVGEPIWPGRSVEEIREATRHEALINLAWPEADIRVLCPYDAAALEPWVLADAERTHPHVAHGRHARASHAYRGPTFPPGCDEPLPAPPPTAISREFALDGLASVRAVVADQAAAAGLSRERAADVTLAVNELAANTLRHAHDTGRLLVWSSPGRIVCQVEDAGHIADPLAGRRQPLTPAKGGLGLWMVNQLCDLVEIRTGAGGTTVRIHAGAS